jgi:hypothetical protein
MSLARRLLAACRVVAGGGGGGLTVTTPVAIWQNGTSASFSVTAGDLIVVAWGTYPTESIVAPTNSGTAFTWTQRESLSTVLTIALYSAVASTSQTMTVTTPTGGDFEHGFLWVISGQHASPFGVADDYESTTNAHNTNYTASANGSVTLVHAIEYQELGAPTSSNLTDVNVEAGISGYAEVICGYKPNAAAGATSFNLDAGGAGGPNWEVLYLEILPA